MSDQTTLELPFPYRVNPHQDAAAAHHSNWLGRHSGLAAGTNGLAYAAWSVAELAAMTSPTCGPEELGLAADLLGFYFLFDDQFDTGLGRLPGEVTAICDRLTGIVHGADPDPGIAVETAFADIWQRSIEHRSPRWQARAAYNWEWYFASHPSEAAGRISDRLPDRDGYMMLRRGTAAMETLFDMVERLGHLEVPQAAFHHPVLRQLRQLAADIPSLSNDVRSYPLEAPRGDVYNLVMIVQRERSCSAEEACAVVMAEAQLMVDRFADLSEELPLIHQELELTEQQAESTRRYVEGLGDWLAGYLHWEAYTGRYQPA